MKTSTVLGLALIGANLYLNSRPATGTGTADDPFRTTTYSPLLAAIGVLVLMIGEQ